MQTKTTQLAGRGGHNAGQTMPVEILTPDEVRALIRAASKRAPTGIRNRALIVTMYRGGLRLSEALALMPKDIDTKAGTVRVLRGKGKKARTVGLDPGATAVLDRWLDKRAKLGLTGRQPLFCSITKGAPFGRPLYPQYVRQALNRLAERAGIEKRVHPHGLRHAHAAELAAEGVPVNVVQRQLGHASLAVTSRYLDHIASADLIETVRARSWSLH
jgi:site-specific recombinase XerD